MRMLKEGKGSASTDRRTIVLRYDASKVLCVVFQHESIK